MFWIIKTEFRKIKRYHILLIGVIGMICSPLLYIVRSPETTQKPWYEEKGRYPVASCPEGAYGMMLSLSNRIPNAPDS